MTISIKGLQLDVIGAIDTRLGYGWREGVIVDREDGTHDVILADGCSFSIEDDIVILETHDGIKTYLMTLFNTEYIEILIC